MNETNTTQCMHKREERSDPVGQWRRMWRWGVFIAQWPRNRAEALVLAHRRWYGSYLSVGLDLALTLAGHVVLPVALLALVVGLFVVKGHDPAVAAGQREVAAWLTSPQAMLAGDSFHLNDRGYACIAEVLAEGLARLVASR